MSALPNTPENIIQFPALTHDDVTVLTAPFGGEDHEFLNGFAYIREEAITSRLDMVDPAWSFNVTEITRRAGTPGEVVTVSAHLTVKGVTRGNTGMAMVELNKSGSREANEAEKSATTDAFKRCARLFGVGRYLLSMPKGASEQNISKILWDMFPHGNPLKDRQQTTTTTQPIVDGSTARKAEMVPDEEEAPEPEAQPTTMQVRLAGAEVRESKNGKAYIVLSTEKSDGNFGPRVTIWTRQILVEAGVIGKDDWGTVGETYVLNTRTTVEIKQDETTGYWDLVRVVNTEAPPPVDTEAVKKSLGSGEKQPVGRESAFTPSHDISVIATAVSLVQHGDEGGTPYVRFYGEGDNDGAVLMIEQNKFNAMAKSLANGDAYINTVKLLEPGAKSKAFKALMLPDLEVLAIKVGDRYQVQKVYENNVDF